MLNLKDGTLWQWDTGRKVVITLDEGRKFDKIQFYNGIGDIAYEGKTEYDGEGNFLGCIPDTLLQHANNLTVYLMSIDEDGVKTTEQITIKVNKRAKPEDYVFTNEEILTYREYDKRLQNVEENYATKQLLNDTATEVKLYSDKTLNESVVVINANVEEVSEVADEALTIAKGKNRARVFSTTEALKAWLADEANKGICNVGDNLYIVDVGVPDWWVSEILEEPNDEGLYYNIAQLETQKVDLTTIEYTLEAHEERLTSVEGLSGSLSQSLQNLTLGYVGENIIPYPYYETTHTDNGITWTDNGDGTVTANGTATSASVFYMVHNTSEPIQAEKCKYTLSGCPSGGSPSKYAVRLYESTKSLPILCTDIGAGAVFDNSNGNILGIATACVIYKGTTVENLTFKPMLVKGSHKCDYAPYSLSKAKLREDIDSVNSSLTTLTQKTSVSLSVSGSAMRLLKTGETFTENDITFNKYLINGVISLSDYISSSTSEKYLGYVMSGYPKVSVIPIKAILTTQDTSITQECTLYLKTNGGLYLSVPQALKSALFNTICIVDSYWVY